MGTEPSFSNVERAEVIDKTLSNTNMYDKITDWKVNTEKSMSDHNMIDFGINTQQTYTREEYRNRIGT